MKVSLLIHNWNRAAALDRCLASVQVQTHRPLEVVLLDADSTDDSSRVIACRSGQLAAAGIEILVRRVPLTGVATSRNMAARLATGELLCGLDNDGMLDSPDTLANAVEYFRNAAGLGVLSFRVLFRDTDALDPSCWIYRRPSYPWAEREFETFTFTGGAFMARADAFWSAGGFWDLLSYSREEEELCLGLLDLGWKILYSPRIVMRHYPESHAARDVTQRRFVEMQNGLLVFWRRFPLPAAVALGVARITTMSLRLALREKGSLRQVITAIPQAARLWRTKALRRIPISWRAMFRYLALHRAQGRAEEILHSPLYPQKAARIDVLGCPYDAVSFDETVDRIEQAARHGGCLHIVTGNVDFVMKARKDPDFARELWEADLVVPDGVPILWAARVLGQRLKGRVNGTDLVWACAGVSARFGISVALVGATLEVAEKAARQMGELHPGAQIYPIRTPYPLGEEANATVVQAIRDAGAGIVLVALGAPRQERWIRDHLAASGAGVGIGVGSAFDLISGERKRAPRWMQRHGLEWLHRLVQEPGRLGKRYLVEDMPFFWHLIREAARRRIGGRTEIGPHSGPEDQ